MFRHGKCLLLSATLLTGGLFCTSFDNPDVFSENSSSNLLYALDFSDINNLGKNTSRTAFADAILQNGNTITSVDGPQGKKGINLPGGTQKVNYLEVPTDIFEGQDVVSISGWYYLPSGVESYLGEIGIYSPENDVAFRSDLYASFHNNDYIFCAGNPSGINLNTGVAPVYDAWYHMTYVIDGANHEFNVYENGDLVLTQELDPSFSPSQYASETAHFYLGQSSYSGYHEEGPHNDYKGQIADFRIYSEALDEASIETLYNFTASDFLTDEWTFGSEETYLSNNVRDYDLGIYKDPDNTKHHFVIDSVSDNGYVTIDVKAGKVKSAISQLQEEGLEVGTYQAVAFRGNEVLGIRLLAWDKNHYTGSYYVYTVNLETGNAIPLNNNSYSMTLSLASAPSAKTLNFGTAADGNESRSWIRKATGERKDRIRVEFRPSNRNSPLGKAVIFIRVLI